jgi:hypothetical protein
MTHHNIASANFSKKTLKNLQKKGIFITSSFYSPGRDGTFANGETVYQLSNGQVRTFLEILAIA